MQARAEAAEKTRQRIIEATMGLHFERGVLATSHKDIAARADVSVGTVYHHFPDLDAIVRACGAQTRQTYPTPSEEVIDSADPLAKRIEQLAAALVDMWAAMPWVERLRTERDRVAPLDFGLSQREKAVEQLIRRALGRSVRRKDAATLVAATLDAAVVHRLLSAGWSRKQVADTLASLINAWLRGDRS